MKIRNCIIWVCIFILGTAQISAKEQKIENSYLAITSPHTFYCHPVFRGNECLIKGYYDIESKKQLSINTESLVFYDNDKSGSISESGKNVKKTNKKNSYNKDEKNRIYFEFWTAASGKYDININGLILDPYYNITVNASSPSYYLFPNGNCTLSSFGDNKYTNKTNIYSSLFDNIYTTKFKVNTIVTTSPTINASWWNTSWLSRKQINITGVGTLTNFPAFINVTKLTGMSNNYYDLRFINGSCGSSNKVLSYEIENYTSTRAVTWVKIPSIIKGVNRICMYYNNPSANNGQNKTGVWDSNYKFVSHMGDSPNTNANISDSTLNNYNGVKYSANNPSKNTSCIIGNCQYFDGTSEYITIPKLNNTPTKYTYEFLMKRGGSPTTWSTFFGGQTNRMTLYLYNSNGYLYFGTTTGDENNNWEARITNTTTWHWVAIVVDSTSENKAIFYTDGRNSLKLASIISSGTWTNPKIGQLATVTAGFYFGGMMDEVRVSTTNRTASWINQSYNMITKQNQFVKFESASTIPTTNTYSGRSIHAYYNHTYNNSLKYWLKIKKENAGLQTLTVFAYKNQTHINSTKNKSSVIQTGWDVIPIQTIVINGNNKGFRLVAINTSANISELTLIQESFDGTPPTITDCNANVTNSFCGESLKFSCNVTDNTVVQSVFFGVNQTTTDTVNSTSYIYTMVDRDSPLSDTFFYNFTPPYWGTTRYNLKIVTAYDYINNSNTQYNIANGTYYCCRPDWSDYYSNVTSCYGMNASHLVMKLYNDTEECNKGDLLPLDNGTISNSSCGCIPDWSPSYVNLTNCTNATKTFIKELIYFDTNVCNETSFLPIDNGTDTNSTCPPIPIVGALIVGGCPTTTSSIMVLGIFIFIALALVFIGTYKLIGIYGFFGGVILIVSSWYLVGCSNILGYIMALIGLMMIIIFAIFVPIAANKNK